MVQFNAFCVQIRFINIHYSKYFLNNVFPARVLGITQCTSITRTETSNNTPLGQFCSWEVENVNWLWEQWAILINGCVVDKIKCTRLLTNVITRHHNVDASAMVGLCVALNYSLFVDKPIDDVSISLVKWWLWGFEYYVYSFKKNTSVSETRTSNIRFRLWHWTLLNYVYHYLLLLIVLYNKK